MGRALELADIHFREYPSDSAPTTKVRAALELVTAKDPAARSRIEVLEDALREVLAAVYDKDGAILRPSPALVEKLQQVSKGYTVCHGDDIAVRADIVGLRPQAAKGSLMTLWEIQEEAQPVKEARAA